MPLPLAAVVWTGVRWAVKKGIKKAAKRTIQKAKKTPKPSSKATQKSLKRKTSYQKESAFKRDIQVVDKSKPVGRRGASLAKVAGSKGKSRRLGKHAFKEFSKRSNTEQNKRFQKIKEYGAIQRKIDKNLHSRLGKRTYKYSQRKGSS